MSDDPFNPLEGTPTARPVAPMAAPVEWAKPIPPDERQADPGPMHLADVRAVAAWQDLGMFLAAMAIGTLWLRLGLGVVLLFSPEMDERTLKAGAIPFVALLSTGVVLAILKVRGQSARSVGLTCDRIHTNGPLGLLVLAAAAATFYLFIVLMIVIEPGMMALMEENTDSITGMLPRMHPILLVGLMAVVGFYEELIFRGFLLTRLRRVSGSWWIAVVVSSFLFAAPHAAEQQPVAVLPLFGLGLTFAVFTMWRKSLVPAMIGHALFNSVQLAYLYYYEPTWT